VLQSEPREPRGGAVNQGSGFLPTSYQGTPWRGNRKPILDLANREGIGAARQRQTIDAICDLNLQRALEAGDAEIVTRIATYETANRMQTSAPELRAGPNLGALRCRDTPSFAHNCLLARRHVERGVRFVQLYHWPLN